MAYKPQSVNAILKDQLFLGNLSAGQSVDLRKKIGITHVVSVCPEYASTGPNHLSIPVQDSEYENLLVHLPNACCFIQNALDRGGKVLVHCVMGISRSTTVVCAYLMKTRHMTPAAAIRFVKRWRPCVHPNYGFIRQLRTFAECDYNPSPNNQFYIAWQRSQARNVTKFLKAVIDTTPIIPEQLYISSEFPKDPEQAESLLLDLGITHFISLSPAEVPTNTGNLPSVQYRHVNISSNPEALLLALPDVCDFIGKALSSGGEVLVHSQSESRACTVACAYLMMARHIAPDAAYGLLQDALPLFNPTARFSRHLDLFHACKYHPTTDHPLVKEWVSSNRSQTRRSSSPRRYDNNAAATTLSAVATSMLCETGLDMAAFGETLARIQRQHVV
ncbi:hypothetical protein ONZ45_g5119 [Pleurotus djamor]|nr:hypothetical protein ONZ45_g5119 [Pleurotus djamor]